MKSKLFRNLALCVLLFGVAVGLNAQFSPTLPRIKLKAGGELRVLQVTYGTDADLTYRGSPAWKWKLWDALPKPLRRLVPAPASWINGARPVIPSVGVWLSIRDAQIYGSNGGAVPGFEGAPDKDGEVQWSGVPRWDGSIRLIDFSFVRRDARQLSFKVRVNDELVNVTIDNPAYQKP